MPSDPQGTPAYPPQAQAAPQAPAAPLEHQIAALQQDNARLAAELEALRQRADASAQARSAVIRGGARVLIPILDRHGVVRAFSKLTQTLSAYGGPRENWPPREQVLDDARSLGEAGVRFVVRRRLFVLLFSLIATAIPVIQVYLVVQQNEIIENQNEFFRIQVYDVVSRSMTEGNRNARRMTGALLANAEPEFLADVVQETFDPELSGVWRSEGEGAAVRRLEDAAFRGYLAHAVRRSIANRLATGADWDELSPRTESMVARVVEDAADRVPQVLALGADGARTGNELDEQVDFYFEQIGGVLELHGRIAKTTGQTEAFYAGVEKLLSRTGKMRLADNRFAVAYRVALESFLLDVGSGASLEDPPPSAPGDPAERDALRTKGIDALRDAIGGDALDWDVVAEQGTAP